MAELKLLDPNRKAILALPLPAFKLWHAYYMYESDDREAYPSLYRLVTVTKMSRTTIIKARKYLLGTGWLVKLEGSAADRYSMPTRGSHGVAIYRVDDPTEKGTGNALLQAKGCSKCTLISEKGTGNVPLDGIGVQELYPSGNVPKGSCSPSGSSSGSGSVSSCGWDSSTLGSARPGVNPSLRDKKKLPEEQEPEEQEPAPSNPSDSPWVNPESQPPVRSYRLEPDEDTPEFRYPCPYCEKRFRYNSRLVDHIHSTHPGEPIQLEMDCEECLAWSTVYTDGDPDSEETANQLLAQHMEEAHAEAGSNA